MKSADDEEEGEGGEAVAMTTARARSLVNSAVWPCGRRFQHELHRAPRSGSLSADEEEHDDDSGKEEHEENSE
jgi:hypothetical protein